MGNTLEQLGFKKRTHIGISLSANNFVELVCVDKETKSVIKYASGNVKYNTAIREIMDYDEFSEVIEGLFAEAGLKPEECSVTLNLPNVHFGITTLESNYETPFIIENLQTEIEDLYIFKRNEPAISYSILPTSSVRNQQTVAYSALQSKAVGRILEIFDLLQADVSRIDNSYCSFMKALQFCDRFEKYFRKEEKTAVLLVTATSCVIFNMNGKDLVDYAEEPIAVKSLSTDEVYATVSKMADTAISKNAPDSFLTISETDEVDAEYIISNLEFAGEKDFFNKSITRNDDFIDISDSHSDIDSNMVSFLTLEAVGAAVSDFSENPVDINFLPAERINPNIIEIGGYEIDLYRFIAIVLLVAVVLAALVGFGIKAILSTQIKNTQDIAQKAETDSRIFKKRIDTNSNLNKKNVFPVLKNIIDNNNAVVNAYSQLSTDIPNNVYIKKFVSNEQGGIGILGEAKSSELVEAFITRLRAKNPDLLVTKLSTNSQNDMLQNQPTSGGLTFEIKTSSKDVAINEQENLLEQAGSKMQNVPTSYENIQNRQTGSGGLTPPPPVI